MHALLYGNPECPQTLGYTQNPGGILAHSLSASPQGQFRLVGERRTVAGFTRAPSYDLCFFPIFPLVAFCQANSNGKGMVENCGVGRQWTSLPMIIGLALIGSLLFVVPSTAFALTENDQIAVLDYLGRVADSNKDGCVSRQEITILLKSRHPTVQAFRLALEADDASLSIVTVDEQKSPVVQLVDEGGNPVGFLRFPGQVNVIPQSDNFLDPGKPNFSLGQKLEMGLELWPEQKLAVGAIDYVDGTLALATIRNPNDGLSVQIEFHLGRDPRPKP